MKTIWKYVLEIKTGRQVLSLPMSAQILSLQMQNENLCLWVLLNDKNMKIDRAIDIYFTGYAVPDNCGVFLGIFQSKQLVFQVFDAGNLGLTVTP